ncbi:hypothetical protein FD754_024495, partial [Muntiacus muntjak]
SLIYSLESRKKNVIWKSLWVIFFMVFNLEWSLNHVMKIARQENSFVLSPALITRASGIFIDSVCYIYSNSSFSVSSLELGICLGGVQWYLVECHPYLNQSKLLEFCKSHDIVLVAYGALGSQRLSQWINPNHPHLLEDPVLCAIAKKHKQTPALVALRYQVQRGVVVLAKSFNKKRIKENIQVMMTLGLSLSLDKLPETHPNFKI